MSEALSRAVEHRPEHPSRHSVPWSLSRGSSAADRLPAGRAPRTPAGGMTGPAPRPYSASMPSPAARHLVKPGSKLDLRDHDPGDTAAFGGDKAAGKQLLQQRNERLEELQEALYAEGRQRLLVVLQAMDAGGKDGTIRSVFAGVNPQGVKVTCFKKPTAAELARDFLWRVHPHVPANGEIAIWNRSHYEDVLGVRVHGLVPPARWRARWDDYQQAYAEALAATSTAAARRRCGTLRAHGEERRRSRRGRTAARSPLVPDIAGGTSAQHTALA